MRYLIFAERQFNKIVERYIEEVYAENMKELFKQIFIIRKVKRMLFFTVVSKDSTDIPLFISFGENDVMRFRVISNSWMSEDDVWSLNRISQYYYRFNHIGLAVSKQKINPEKKIDENTIYKEQEFEWYITLKELEELRTVEQFIQYLIDVIKQMEKFSNDRLKLLWSEKFDRLEVIG